MDWTHFYAEDAPYVAPYSWQHILYLLFCATVIFLFIRNRNRIKDNRDKIAKVFIGIILFQQIFLLYGWYAVVTGFDAAVALPLHICRVATLLTLMFLFTKKMFFADIICYFSIFALVSFFYPMSVYNFSHINGVSYMVNHLMTVLFPIFAIVAYGWRPTWKTYRNAVIGFAIYFPLALFANYVTVTGNYFYQTDRPFLKDMPAWQYGALSAIVTLAGFAVVPAVYSLLSKKSMLSATASKLNTVI